MQVKVKVKKRRKEAILPRYMSSGASGFDLHAAIEAPLDIPPGSWKLIPTGLSFEVPQGFEIQIRPRSGLALKGITVLNTPGTIDSDYRGEVQVIIANLSETHFTITPGMRIAQGVLCKVYHADMEEAELSPTQRGEGGFGSTGTG